MQISEVIKPARRRGKERKYFPNEHIDRRLREIYAARMSNGRGGLRIADFARSIGWPKYAPINRAREPGLCRVKEKPWSEKEIEILQECSDLGLPAIQRRLKRAGFERTKSAIHIKRTRWALKGTSPWFSANAVAILFGIDRHEISRWIGLGYIKARLKEQEQVNSDRRTWLIHESDIRRFILEHPTEFDIRKITDQVWFLDLVTNGKIGGGR